MQSANLMQYIIHHHDENHMKTDQHTQAETSNRRPFNGHNFSQESGSFLNRFIHSFEGRDRKSSDWKMMFIDNLILNFSILNSFSTKNHKKYLFVNIEHMWFSESNISNNVFVW